MSSTPPLACRVQHPSTASPSRSRPTGRPSASSTTRSRSRLCADLFHYIEERPGLTRWRQGRCLPYGEGIAFWALGEIIKAECGILESDLPQEAEAKLEQ